MIGLLGNIKNIVQLDVIYRSTNCHVNLVIWTSVHIFIRNIIYLDPWIWVSGPKHNQVFFPRIYNHKAPNDKIRCGKEFLLSIVHMAIVPFILKNLIIIVFKEFLIMVVPVEWSVIDFLLSFYFESFAYTFPQYICIYISILT